MATRIVYSCDGCTREWPGEGQPRGWGEVAFGKYGSDICGFNSFEMGKYLICDQCILQLRDTMPLLKGLKP